MTRFERDITVTLVERDHTRAGPFDVFDKLAWEGNHWREDGDGVNTLVQDTAAYEQIGFIEFKSTQEKGPQRFTVAFGLHNGLLWSAINTGYGALTLAQISGWYRPNSDLEIIKDLHWRDRQVIHAGRAIRVRYTQTEGQSLSIEVTV